ncbi:MAG TPA: Fe-S cluster assembly protein SufD, partial [Ktedonobacterales bacterium]|nr:Fe-S cluster assembly protein SufD [Ktedonobacterales bacterium]
QDPMTAPVARRGFNQEALEELIARRDEPEWMRQRRLDAWKIYQATPMPTRQDEEWRRTDLRRLKLDDFDTAAATSAVGGTLVPPAERNEAFAGFLGLRNAQAVEYRVSDEAKARGVIFCDLATAVREHGDLLRESFMTLVVKPEDTKFTALHGAFWDNGVFVYVPRGVTLEQPLRAIISADMRGKASLSHTLIVMEEGSEAVYAEDFISPESETVGFSSRVLEIIARDGAKLRYIGTQRWGRKVYDFHEERALLERDAQVTLQTIELGSQLSKGRVESLLRGNGGHAKLLGLYIEDGKQHLDRYTLQDHVGANCVSDLLYKGVLTDEARSIFSGMIRVHPTGIGTAAYQQNRNLLLSRHARADSIPNLEIGANDIIGCSHGATVGKVDEEQLFYLMCRGLSRLDATHLIVEGFVDPIINEAPIASLRDSLRQEIRDRVSTVEAY